MITVPALDLRGDLSSDGPFVFLLSSGSPAWTKSSYSAGKSSSVCGAGGGGPAWRRACSSNSAAWRFALSKVARASRDKSSQLGIVGRQR
jgi:hypothetical protein